MKFYECDLCGERKEEKEISVIHFQDDSEMVYCQSHTAIAALCRNHRSKLEQMNAEAEKLAVSTSRLLEGMAHIRECISLADKISDQLKTVREVGNEQHRLINEYEAELLDQEKAIKEFSAKFYRQ